MQSEPAPPAKFAGLEECITLTLITLNPPWQHHSSRRRHKIASLVECLPRLGSDSYVDGLVVAGRPSQACIPHGRRLDDLSSGRLPQTSHRRLLARSAGRRLDSVGRLAPVPSLAFQSYQLEGLTPLVPGGLGVACGRPGRKCLHRDAASPNQPKSSLIQTVPQHVFDDTTFQCSLGGTCMEGLCTQKTRDPILATAFCHCTRRILGHLASSIVADDAQREQV